MKTPFAHQTILVLAPHTDDAELGCGGTIVRLMEEGKEVHVAAFSSAKESLPQGAPPTQLVDEFYASMHILNIPAQNVHFFDFPVRRFPQVRQEILEYLLSLRAQITPDLVFLPSQNDVHQDHQTVAQEGLRAFKEVSVWGYELPWNTLAFASQTMVGLNLSHVEAKWRALQAYRSQIELKRPYFTWEFIKSLAHVRGVQMKTDFAEAFEIVRMRF